MSDPVLTEEKAAERLAITIGRFYRLIRTATGGLSHGLLSALATVAKVGPLRPADLAELEGYSAPSATRVVAELQARGLVEREQDPEDGRAILIAATEAGQAALLRARAARTVAVGAMLEGLDDDERATVIAALPALEHMIGE